MLKLIEQNLPVSADKDEVKSADKPINIEDKKIEILNQERAR